jgi:hypothetical protein
MSIIRADVTAFAKCSEVLLSKYFEPPVNKDERDLIAYYLDELARRYEAKSNVQTPNSDTPMTQ